jgi:hypothetical protein
VLAPQSDAPAPRAERTAPEPENPPPAKARAVDAPAPTPPEPEQRTGESDKAFERREEQYRRELRRSEGEVSKLRAQLERSKTEYETKLAEASKKAPTQLTAREYRELTEAVVRGEVVLSDREVASLPPEVAARLEALERAAEKATEAESEAQYSQVRSREVGVVKEYIQSNSLDYPLITEAHADFVLDSFYAQFQRTGAKPQIDSVLREVHEGLARTLKAALSSEQARQYLSLGEQQTTASPASRTRGDTGDADSPRGLTNRTVSRPTSPSTAPTLASREERAKLIAARYRAGRQG